MKRVLINSGLALIFSITLISVLFCLTALNDNFVIKVMKDTNYYDEVYKDINVDLKSNYKNDECSIEKEVLIKDINTYVKKNYNSKKIKNNIKCKSDKDLKSVYLDYIKIKGLDKLNMNLIYYGLFLIVMVLVIIVGSIFINTRKKHDLNSIILISFPIILVVNLLLYLFGDFSVDIINNVIDRSNHLILAVNIILFEIIIFKKIMTRFK